MKEPWICPRCRTVNAPFNPQCFCSETSEVGITTAVTSGYEEIDINRHQSDVDVDSNQQNKCKHEFGNEIYASNPPQVRCKKCFQFFSLGNFPNYDWTSCLC